MLKKTITYTDFNDNEVTETFYFNLSKAELVEMDLKSPGGMKAKIEEIINRRDIPTISEIFKEIIMLAYGEKSDDGKRFVKSRKMSEAFTQTNAYSVLYLELITNPEAAADFVNGIMPKA